MNPFGDYHDDTYVHAHPFYADANRFKFRVLKLQGEERERFSGIFLAQWEPNEILITQAARKELIRSFKFRVRLTILFQMWLARVRAANAERDFAPGGPGAMAAQAHFD